MAAMTNKVLAIIPARGGSKGLPRKNIVSLAGKPLIQWTIEASLNSKFITKTLVSSEDDEILKISELCGADTLKRPIEYASDTSSSQDVILSVIDSLEEEFDFIVLLQPTSPLRESIDIDLAFQNLLSSEADSVISVVETDNKILKAFIINSDGFLGGISNNDYPFMRRQDLPNVYMSNGAIYIFSYHTFLREKTFLSDKTIMYPMSKVSSFDIDTKEDLEAVEKLLGSSPQAKYSNSL
jgi:CMP-N-acetylneuraminic acid synthetase